MADQTTPPIVNLDSVNEAGDVITEEIFITAANGNNYDIRNFCIGVTLFEDVFSKKTTFELDTKFDGVTTANFSTDRLFEKTSFQPPGITKRFNSSYKLEELETVDDQ